MSMTGIQSLGQENGNIVQPYPVYDIPGQAYAGLQTFWQTVRDQCEQHFTPSQCQSLLGSRPTILQQDREGLAWYWLVGIGVVIGKVVL